MGFKDLLGDEPYVPPTKRPFQLVRGTDPGTSYEAASLVVGKLRPLQQRVLDELTKAGSRGLTDLELEIACGSHGSTYRTRRSELVEKKLVVDSGTTRHQNGRNRIVWKRA